MYDAYYYELEQYAHHQARFEASGGAIAPPPGPGPFPGSIDASTLPADPPAPAPGTGAAKKPGSLVKPTRDHKNVRPAPAPAANTNAAGKKKSADTGADAPAHGEPGHTHSPSCPHHPHNHGPTNQPPSAAAKAKAAAEHYDDEDDDELDDDEEYDDDEYDDDDVDDDDVDDEYDDDDDFDSVHGHHHHHHHHHDHSHPAAPGLKKLAKPVGGPLGQAKALPTDADDFTSFGKTITVKGECLRSRSCHTPLSSTHPLSPNATRSRRRLDRGR